MNADELLVQYLNKSKLKVDVLWAYLSAQLYRPGNIVNMLPEDPTIHNQCIHGKPDKLLTYCGEFKDEDIIIEKNLELVQCKCSINNPHLFMKDEGFFHFHTCQSILCKYCIASNRTDFLPQPLSTYNFCIKC